jgi:hypothetical protein
MTNPTAALAASPETAARTVETCFPPLTLVPAAPRRESGRRGPRCFTVQITPQVHVLRPLPAGLTDREAPAYVRAYARTQGHDCCLESAGTGTVYYLSDGTQFEPLR